MTGDKLTIKQLEKGDILLVEDWRHDVTHFGIAAGQAVASHGTNASSNVTHAGLHDGIGRILEASGGEGLRGAKYFEVHKGTKYQVYRYGLATSGNWRRKDWKISNSATEWAKKLVAHRHGETNKKAGFGRYTLSGSNGTTLGGLFSSSERGTGAQNAVANLVNDPYADRGFYCSNFVVECYELACNELGLDPVIEVDYRKVSPKALQSVLRNSNEWQYVGNYTVEGIAS